MRGTLTVRISALWLLGSCTVSAVTIPLAAQNAPVSSAALATISGTAVDSLRGGYLGDAVVRVNGTSRATTTDSLGRFRIDSIAPGTRQLEILHPLLDTLGLSLKTGAMDLHPGDNGRIVLAIPSAATIISRKCTAAERRVGPAAAFGMVLDADTDAPAVGAQVSLDWLDLESSGNTFTKVPRRRTAAVQSDGSFRICGLPPDFSANAIASRGSEQTSVVGVNFAPLLAMVTLFLPGNTPAAALGTRDSAAAASGSATVTGHVTGPDGAPIARARVAVEDEEQVTLSGTDGAFTLRGLKSGTRALSVRALGFQPVEIVVALSSRAPRDVRVRLDKFVAVLATVKVVAQTASLDRVGFAERKKSNDGKFFTPQDIESRRPLNLNNLLEGAPMLRVRRAADGRSYVTGRLNGCVRYFVDGQRWLGPQDDIDSAPANFLSGAELGAVEVYDTMSAPGEYAAAASNGAPCTVVLIWTKFKLRI